MHKAYRMDGWQGKATIYVIKFLINYLFLVKIEGKGLWAICVGLAGTIKAQTCSKIALALSY